MIYRTAPFSVTLNDPTTSFQGHAIFDAEYLRNGTIYRHSFNLHALLIMSFRMILSDLEWLSKIFNDKKRRAVSLRQLSFLFTLEALKRHRRDRPYSQVYTGT